MKIYIIHLILSSTFLFSSCGHYYSIATSRMPAANYKILETGDSSIRIIPSSYSFEPMLEVIREHSQIIPIDSLTRVAKIYSSIGYTFVGIFAGFATGAAIGYLTYQKPTCYFCLDFGPGISALLGAFLGIIPGGIIGYLLTPEDIDMLPKIRQRNKWPDEMKYIK